MFYFSRQPKVLTIVSLDHHSSIIDYIVVKCSQTGKLHQVKLKDLSREDCESLTKDDLVKGTKLMAKMKGKVYPVQFVQFKDKASGQKSAGKSEVRSDENLEKATPTRKEKSH